MTNHETETAPGYRISEPDVIHQLFGREVVVIDLRTGSYYSLSDSAGEAWIQLGAGGGTVEQVARAIATHYQVPVEQAAQDLIPFFAELRRLELITPCEPAARNAPPDVPVAEGGTYTPPTLAHYNDLQDLFLLDPVHDVDAVAGWPHPAPGSTMESAVQGTTLRAVRGGDRLRATLHGTTLLVNRDLSVYATLNAGATELWQALEAGPVTVTDAAVRDALHAAGLVEPAPGGSTVVPTHGAGATVSIHRDLEAMMRPWIRTPPPPARADRPGVPTARPPRPFF